MRCLAVTQVMLWWLFDDPRLVAESRQLLARWRLHTSSFVIRAMKRVRIFYRCWTRLVNTIALHADRVGKIAPH